MKSNQRHKGFTPKRTLVAVAVSAALFGSTLVQAANKADKSSVESLKSSEQMLDRSNYTDDQWEAIVRSSLAVRVQSNLSGSASLRGADIKVSADEDGEVTLSGEVSSERQRERAVRIAKRTMGVSEIDDDLDVNESMAGSASESIDDEELAKRVAQTIAAEFDGAKVEESWFFGYEVEGRAANGEEWTLEVDADEGAITLDGELPSNADVQTVLQATRRIGAVKSVENDITSDELDSLGQAPGRYRYYAPGYMYSGTLVTGNGKIQGEIVCQLATYDGMHRKALVGKAKHADASTTMKATPKLTNRPVFSNDDWQAMHRSSLTVRVQSNLAYSEALRNTDLTAKANADGEVTVSGKVANERQKERALRIAKRTAGVKKVNDALTVDANLSMPAFEPLKDEMLAKTVAEAIARGFPGSKVEESWFFGYHVNGRSKTGRDWQIEVDADEGEIVLDGDVPRNEDVAKALRITRDTAGVRRIDNDIDSNEERLLVYAPAQYRYHAPGSIHHPAALTAATGPADGELICQVASLNDDGKRGAMAKTKAD